MLQSCFTTKQVVVDVLACMKCRLSSGSVVEVLGIFLLFFFYVQAENVSL